MITPEQMQRQLDHEQEQISRGIEEYLRKVNTTPLSEQTVGMRLLRESIEPLRESIDTFKYLSTGNKKYVSLLNLLEMDSYELSYLILKAAFSTMSERMSLTRACGLMSGMVLDHHTYLQFKHQNPGYLYKMEQDWQERGTSQIHKRNAMVVKTKKLGLSIEELSHEDKMMLGQKLLDLLITSTKLFEVITEIGHDGRDRYYLSGTEETLKWIENQHELCQVMTPFWMPMLIHPKPWTNFRNGGYYSDNITLRNKLVKTRNKKAQKLLRETSMPEVYSAINSIQETPWRVNKDVLEVLQAAWESDSKLGGLPNREPEPVPPKPWNSDEEFKLIKETQKEVFDTWRRAAVAVYQGNAKIRGKRVNMITRIKMAEKLQDEPTIYYPHCLDFRSRVYPIPTCGGMHPQSDDSGKALLEFAEGIKLGERGLYWLKVHLANTYGFDKAPLDDRATWVDQNKEAILDSANNPLDGSRFWCDADSPYCFLAACIDYCKSLYNPNHESHLPIAMDGSCNGLQNFSAMLRDEVGGAEVNLVPREKPADIYSKVAEHVHSIVVKEATEGNDNAQLWVGKIDRKMAKRNVMTLPYGAKKYGFKDQLLAELDSREERYLDVDDYFAPAVYLADRMYNGIGDIVIAARAAMDWLQTVSSVVNQSKEPIHWTTPAGFVAFQEYQIQESKQIDTFWGCTKLRVKVTLKLDTNKIDVRKQTTGISPNFVHSMDACHLMKTVNRLKARGINSFAMIHDSYGTHAANVDILHEELREAFIAMYTDHDVLEEFRQTVIDQLPEELKDKVPHVPPKGTLDLNQVRHSHYFFA